MKRNLLIITVAIAAIISCQRPEIENGQKGDGKVVYVYNPETMPDGMSGWPHMLFLFDDTSCIEILETVGDGTVSPSETPLKMVAVACPDPDAFSSGAADSGLPASLYRLDIDDMDMEIPEIWSQVITGGNTAEITLERSTARLSVTTTAAPENIGPVSLTLPGLTNRFLIYSRTFEKTGKDATDMNLTAEPDMENVYNIFPMASDEAWFLEGNIPAGDDEIKYSMRIPSGIAAGNEVKLDFDFSAFASDGRIGISYRYADHGSNKWTEVTSSASADIEKPRKRSSWYEVSVLQPDGTWKDMDVHYALCSDAASHHTQIWNDWNNSKKLRDTMSFVNFTADFDSPVSVRIKYLKGSFSDVKVRPGTYGITATDIGNNTVQMEIPSYEKRKLSVEFDNDRFHNLFILPDRPDTGRPDPDRIPEGMRYYGPGEHNPEYLNLYAGETLYIDEGAIVYAKINVLGDNVTIAGRGILSGEKLPHTGGQYATGLQLIETNANHSGMRQNFTVEGITVIDSPNWTFSIYNTGNVKIHGVNIINWILNGDGIDLCSVEKAEVSDCFIRTYDDCITMKIVGSSSVDCSGITLSRNLIWCDYARGIIVGPESGSAANGTGNLRDITIEDCILLEHPVLNSPDGDCAALSISQYCTGSSYPAATISDISIRNITIDNISSAGRPLVIYQQAGNGNALIKDVDMENIEIISPGGSRECAIYTHGNKIENLVFRNVTYNGTPVKDSGKFGLYGDNIDIVYE